MRPLPFLCALAISGLLLTGCHAVDQAKSPAFAPDSLATYTVDIRVDRDTVIHAPGGSLIHIPAYALDAEGLTHVKLAIREALRISDIVRAGLLTRSNKELLSSGGMIDIEAVAGQTVKITKAIGISVPTPYLEKDMQLFKGVKDGTGNLNWTDPQPLAPNPQQTALDTGQKIFMTHCASCHALGKVITGPQLAYITSRRDKKWLYDFTRNNVKMLRSGDRYANCVFEQYNKTAMNIFPALTDAGIDAIFRYVDNESKRLGLPVPDDHCKKCVDSCILYEKAAGALRGKRQQLIADNGPGIKDEMRMPAGYISADTAGNTLKVAPASFPSIYYQFSIQAFGWYNIDILLKDMDGVKESLLTLRITGTYKERINVFLIIPSARVFADGGLLEGKTDLYGFLTLDGRLPLPQQVKAILLAMGEQNGSPVFAMTSFSTSTSQAIDLEPLPTSKEKINAAMRMLELTDLSVQVQDSKNADSIRKVDWQLKDIEKLKPKNCDCNCGVVSDTTAK